MKTLHSCLKSIFSNEFKVSEEVPVGSDYQEVTLEEDDKCSRQKLAIYDIPSHVVVVKCPTQHDELVNNEYKKICDYLVFDVRCNAVILCEMKKQFYGKAKNNAIKQICDTKELVQGIIANMEELCDIGKSNEKIEEHYMMFSSKKKRMDIRKTHKNPYDKKLKLHCFIGLRISYNQIKETIGCKPVNYNSNYERIELITFG